MSARRGGRGVAEGADIIRDGRGRPGLGTRREALGDLCELGEEGISLQGRWSELFVSYSESVRIGGISFVSLPHPGGHGKIRKLDHCDDQVIIVKGNIPRFREQQW